MSGSYVEELSLSVTQNPFAQSSANTGSFFSNREPSINDILDGKSITLGAAEYFLAAAAILTVVIVVARLRGK